MNIYLLCITLAATVIYNINADCGFEYDDYYEEPTDLNAMKVYYVPMQDFYGDHDHHDDLKRFHRTCSLSSESSKSSESSDSIHKTWNSFNSKSSEFTDSSNSSESSKSSGSSDSLHSSSSNSIHRIWSRFSSKSSKSSDQSSSSDSLHRILSYTFSSKSSKSIQNTRSESVGKIHNSTSNYSSFASDLSSGVIPVKRNIVSEETVTNISSTTSNPPMIEDEAKGGSPWNIFHNLIQRSFLLRKLTDTFRSKTDEGKKEHCSRKNCCEF